MTCYWLTLCGYCLVDGFIYLKDWKFWEVPDPQNFPDIHCLWINLFLKGSFLLLFSSMRLFCSFTLFEKDDHIHEHESHVLGNVLPPKVWNRFCFSFLEFGGPQNQNLGQLSLIFEASQREHYKHNEITWFSLRPDSCCVVPPALLEKATSSTRVGKTLRRFQPGSLQDPVSLCI